MRDRLSQRYRAQLESPTNIDDGKGGVRLGWTHLAEHWISLQSISGVEVKEKDSEQPLVTHRILLRYPSSLLPRAKQRFTIGDRIFHIHAAFDQDGKGHYLTCLVKEKIQS